MNLVLQLILKLLSRPVVCANFQDLKENTFFQLVESIKATVSIKKEQVSDRCPDFAASSGIFGLFPSILYFSLGIFSPNDGRKLELVCYCNSKQSGSGGISVPNLKKRQTHQHGFDNTASLTENFQQPTMHPTSVVFQLNLDLVRHVSHSKVCSKQIKHCFCPLFYAIILKHCLLTVSCSIILSTLLSPYIVYINLVYCLH